MCDVLRFILGTECFATVISIELEGIGLFFSIFVLTNLLIPNLFPVFVFCRRVLCKLVLCAVHVISWRVFVDPSQGRPE